MASASGHQTSKSQLGMWSLAVCHDEGKRASSPVGAAPIYGTYSSTTPPAFYLAAASRGGYIQSTLPDEGRQMLQPA